MSAIKPHINEIQKDFLQVLAYVYVQNNQFEKAITVYKALWTLFPESDQLAFNLGYLYYRTQQLETALYYADTYLSKNPSRLGYLLKSKTLLALGRHHEAKATIIHFFN